MSIAAVSGKTPVGVVVDVYGSDVTIINLKDLKFSSYDTANNFNASSPYTGNYSYTYWAELCKDISTLTNYSYDAVKSAIQEYQYW